MNLEEIVKMIEGEFANGQVKQIASKMVMKLEQRGFERIDIDDALDEGPLTLVPFPSITCRQYKAYLNLKPNLIA